MPFNAGRGSTDLHAPKTTMNLTPKQEAFCQAIASGKTQADAYRSAFNASKMKPETIYARASELMADSKLTVRVAEIKKSLENKQLWTREMSVKALIQAYKEGAPSVKVSAVKELNLMHGYNAPQQVNVNTLNPMIIELTL